MNKYYDSKKKCMDAVQVMSKIGNDLNKVEVS